MEVAERRLKWATAIAPGATKSFGAIREGEPIRTRSIIDAPRLRTEPLELSLNSPAFTMSSWNDFCICIAQGFEGSVRVRFDKTGAIMRQDEFSRAGEYA